VCDKLKEFDIECEEDGSLLLSRKISATGKSNCKINGRNATVSMLKELGVLLVNIHGQHDSQALLNPDFHYSYIDMLFDDKSIFEDYRKSFKNLISVRRKLKSLTEEEDNKDSRLELLQYQIKELEDADIKIGEREELTKRKSLITKSEAIEAALNNARMTITGDDEAAGVQTAVKGITDGLSVFQEGKAVFDIFEEINEKLADAKEEIDSLLSEIEFSPAELEEIEDRLDLLYRLSEKYGSSEEDMLDYLSKAKDERNAILFSDKELEKLSEEYDLCLENTVKKAQLLSDLRHKTAEEFTSKVMHELEFLDMPKMQFVVDFQKGNLSSAGFDKIEFLMSSNPGEPPKPLSKIASGGELSRIMLAMKNIIVHNDTIGTLIFDEIDTGVSGRASQKIGLKLKSVSESTQVICVTHSAQIASNADCHFLIKKEFENDRTYTNVTLLDFESRKKELARIMGGLEITDTLLKSAEELLNSH